MEIKGGSKGNTACEKWKQKERSEAIPLPIVEDRFTDFTLDNQKGLQRYLSYDRMKPNLNVVKNLILKRKEERR